jgi:fermentation-respiration switch protein FrsA (DUF1100 family)
VHADRADRALKGQGRKIDAWEIVSPDPASRTFLDALYGEFPELRCELSLDSAEALVEYRPEAIVEQIAPRPVLLVHGEADMLVPIDESRRLFAACGEPRRLVAVPGMAHFDWTGPKELPRVMEILGDWFTSEAGFVKS